MTSFTRPRRGGRRPMPGTGAAPTPSHLPPGVLRRAVLMSQATPGVDRTAVASERGRVVCVFGPPGAGCSTLIDAVTGASEMRTAVLRPGDGDLEDQVRAIRAEVIFIDGYPYCQQDERGRDLGVDAVQYLYDRRLVFPGCGGLIRVAVDPELSVRRGSATFAGIDRWFAGLPALEAHIRLLGLPYFVIHNEPGEQGATTAACQLARRASVQR